MTGAGAAGLAGNNSSVDANDVDFEGGFDGRFNIGLGAVSSDQESIAAGIGFAE